MTALATDDPAQYAAVFDGGPSFGSQAKIKLLKSADSSLTILSDPGAIILSKYLDSMTRTCSPAAASR